MNDLRRHQSSFTMSSMSNGKNQAGFISTMLVALIATGVLLLGSIGFGVWAFMSRQDYKNNSDQKAEKAAAEAKTAAEKAAADKYAQEAKNPLQTHKAPEELGSVAVQYPKTWSGYVSEGSEGNIVVDDYFHPGVVPDAEDRSSVYALRIQVVEQAYDKVLKSYESDVKSKKLSASPYSLPQVKGVVGTRLNGQVERNKQGSLVILPMRNMTLKIWTESPSYLADFNKIILPNIVFSP